MFCRYVSLIFVESTIFKSRTRYERAFMGFWLKGEDLYPEMSPYLPWYPSTKLSVNPTIAS